MTTVLAAVEDSPDSAGVLALAIAMTRLVPGTALHVLHVIDERFWADPDPVPRELLLRRAQVFLESLLSHDPNARAITHIEAGKPVPRILAVAAEISAGLIVVGAGKRGFERAILGSVSTRVTQEACCPVLVARPVVYPVTPAIEPPCAACEEARRATDGATVWCAQHSVHHVHGHTYAELPEPFGVGSSLLRPES